MSAADIATMFNITPGNISALIAFIISGILAIILANKVRNRAERYLFEKHPMISVGDYVDIPTSIGSDPGEIVGYDNVSIIVQCETGKRCLPINQFSQTAWKVLDDKPEWMKKSSKD
ncbi:MAG: hypothetical protein OMM_06618 [Candidatus Magnetoglobus multicellularis str. Araruama]|uniref:Uncharacterized protein n=1 Tax=Candidatus Magnetoglobus multicellularis str. Araruama TaxID=890399 RepID=A0A1V1PGE0_9BACT|nr:MAG: hypothetical protein OMM_06618 [Candidatus Magnetoglobus multicellularis str. Araruama]